MLRNISLPKYLRRPEGCVAKQSDNTYEFRTYVGGDQKAGKFYVSLFYEEKKHYTFLYVGRLYSNDQGLDNGR